MAEKQRRTLRKEWKDYEEDCRQGMLQTQLLNVRAGEAKDKKRHHRLNPVGKKMRKANRGGKRREQLKQLGEVWSQVVISTASLNRSKSGAPTSQAACQGSEDSTAQRMFYLGKKLRGLQDDTSQECFEEHT